MTELNPPGFLQNAGATHTAQQLRLYTAAMVGNIDYTTVPGSSRPFIRGMFISQNSPVNMSVNVGVGAAFVKGTEAATTQGIYTCWNDASKNIVIAAADATLNRIDLVVVRVRDSAYSGATNSWALEVVQGTPAGSPSIPATPVNSMVLAQISVTAGSTTIDTTKITQGTAVVKYTTGLGGFELVDNKSPYDFTGAPLWVYNIADDRFWFQDEFSVSWRMFLTTLEAGRGVNNGAIYQSGSAIYSGTSEAVVTNMTIASMSTDDVSGFQTKWFGQVRCNVRSTVAGDRAAFRVRLDTIAGAQIIEVDVYIPVANVDTPVNFSYYFPGDSSNHAFVLTCARLAGTGTISIPGTTTTNKYFHVIGEEAGNNLVVA